METDKETSPVEKSKTEAGIAGTQLEPKKVLVVEDSITAQKMYEIYVKSSYLLENLSMVFAGTAEKGLHLLKESAFHLIILDWELPGLSGLKFLQQVRSQSNYDDVRIIMCTSVNQKPMIVKAITLGVNDYMVKPVVKQAFLDKIHSNLQA